jgi:hypothetical protein
MDSHVGGDYTFSPQGGFHVDNDRKEAEMSEAVKKRYGWTLSEDTVNAGDEQEAAQLLAEASLADFNANQETSTGTLTVRVQHANRNDWFAHYAYVRPDGSEPKFVREFKVFDAC